MCSSDLLEGVDGLLVGLGGKAVHQVGVHAYLVIRERPHHSCSLLDLDALVDQLQHARGCHLQSARDGDAARLRHQAGDLRRELPVEAYISPP